MRKCLAHPLLAFAVVASLSVYAPSQILLLQFVRALQAHLAPISLRALFDAHSRAKRCDEERLLSALDHEREGTITLLEQRYHAAIESKGHLAAAAAISLTPQTFLQFQREAMLLQINTDEAAAKCSTL